MNTWEEESQAWPGKWGPRDSPSPTPSARAHRKSAKAPYRRSPVLPDADVKRISPPAPQAKATIGNRNKSKTNQQPDTAQPCQTGTATAQAEHVAGKTRAKEPRTM